MAVNRSTLVAALAVPFFFGVLAQATTPSRQPPAPNVLPYAVPAEADVGCSASLENFCDALWAPNFEGNIRLLHGTQMAKSPPRVEDQILLGRAANQTSFPYRLFNQAKLDAAPYLPAAFLKRLNERHYFDKLRRNLAVKPLVKMSRAEVEANRALYQELATLWEQALEESAIDEVSQKHVGFFRLTEEHMPMAISQEYYRAKDALETEANRAIWSHHPRWNVMLQLLEEIKRDLISVIDASAGPSPSLKETWKNRMTSIELMLPGTDSELLDDRDRSCASTERNAVYWTLRDKLEICGGYILNGDPSRTVAHELAHSLGVHRNEVDHLFASPLAKRLSHAPRPHLRRSDAIPCSEWEQWKKDFREGPRDLRHAGPDLDPKIPFVLPNARDQAGAGRRNAGLHRARMGFLQHRGPGRARPADPPDEERGDPSRRLQAPESRVPRPLRPLLRERPPRSRQPELHAEHLFRERVPLPRGNAADSPAKRLEDSVEGARKLELDLRVRELATREPFLLDP